MRRARLLLSVLAAWPAAAAAQTPPPWTASLVYAQDAFDGSAPAWSTWQTWTAGAGRRFAHGAVAIEAGRVHRFGLDDEHAAVDVYRNLWPRAYANARVDLAPSADVIARSDLSAELFQDFAHGWEPSVAYRRMGFADATVGILSGSVGRFVGPWYGRIRVARAARASTASASVAALLRRTFGPDDDQIEVSATQGGEVETVTDPATGAPVADVRHTRAAAVSARLFFGRRTGVTLGLGRTGFEGIPARTSASAGVSLRW